MVDDPCDLGSIIEDQWSKCSWENRISKNWDQEIRIAMTLKVPWISMEIENIKNICMHARYMMNILKYRNIINENQSYYSCKSRITEDQSIRTSWSS